MQNHVTVWVGGDLKEHLVPTFLLWARSMGRNKVHIQFNVKTFFNGDNKDKETTVDQDKPNCFINIPLL